MRSSFPGVSPMIEATPPSDISGSATGYVPVILLCPETARF
jgi:hypothetical protein